MDKHLHKPEIYSAPGMKARRGRWEFGLCKVKGIPPKAGYERLFTAWSQGLVEADNTATFASSWKEA